MPSIIAEALNDFKNSIQLFYVYIFKGQNHMFTEFICDTDQAFQKDV
jgi:hypothetical protein